jgi:hypothetical protein
LYVNLVACETFNLCGVAFIVGPVVFLWVFVSLIFNFEAFEPIQTIYDMKVTKKPG